MPAVETFQLEAKLSKPFANSRAFHERRNATLVAITTDSGITGWGEAFGPARMSHGAAELVKPMLIGADPLATDQIWQRLFHRFREHGQKGPLIDALSAIDIALWDIKGKHFGLPIHRLMGGPIRTEVPVYATGLYRSRDGDPEKYLAEEAAGYIAEGFRAVKLKVGFGVDADVRAVRAVRRAIGDKPQMMIDANAAYERSRRSSCRAASRMRHLLVRGAGAADRSRRLPRREARDQHPGRRRRSRVHPLGFSRNSHDAGRWTSSSRMCAAGGFSECKIIADMAAAFGVRCNPHTWGTAIAIAASLQWLATVPDSPPSLNAVQPMLELDQTEHPIRDALLVDVLKPGRGTIKIPDGPGLGIEVDREAVKRFQVA